MISRCPKILRVNFSIHFALQLLDFRLEIWKRCLSRSLNTEAAISRGLGGACLTMLLPTAPAQLSVAVVYLR